MPVVIGVPAEVVAGEGRVGLVPEVAKKFTGLGANICLQAGAGTASYFRDEDYAGATVVGSAADVYAKSQIIFKVAPPSAEEIDAMASGTVLIGYLAPYSDKARLEQLAARNITSFAVELIPRISRAQSMDALSSQACCLGLPVRIDRRQQLPEVSSDAHLRRRYHSPGACAGHRCRRGGPAGDCHRQASWRHRRRLRCAAGDPRADRIARCEIRRHRRLGRRQRWLRARTDRRRKGRSRQKSSARRSPMPMC